MSLCCSWLKKLLGMLGSGADAAAGGVLGQRWRWRLLSAAVLPDYSRREHLLAPAQALQLRVSPLLIAVLCKGLTVVIYTWACLHSIISMLQCPFTLWVSTRTTIGYYCDLSVHQGAVEMRMWAASEAEEAAAARPEQAPQAQPAAALAEGASPAPPAAAGPAAPEPGQAAAGGGEEEAARKPLEVLHGVLRDVGARLALNEAVMWARGASGEGGHWGGGRLRLERASALPVGLRCA